MRRFQIFILAAGLLAGGSALAHDQNFGLGLVVGEPTGVSGKLWLSQTTAIDGGLAWSSAGDGDLHLQGDYLVHDFGLFEVDRGALPVYYGIGGRIKFNDEGRDRVGVRVPVGLAYIFESSRVDLFMEIAPILDLAPDTDVTANGGIGVRYFFN
jgi:hypothetical protein